MRITIALLLLVCCSCGILKRSARTETSTQTSDSVFRATEGKVVFLDQIDTRTRVYGDTLKGGFTLPLDSMIPPVWLESTGVTVGVSARLQDGKLGLNVTAIAKPRTETQASQRSEYSAETNEQAGAVQKSQSVTVTQTSSRKWVLPWYAYVAGAAALAILIYQIFKRYIQ